MVRPMSMPSRSLSNSLRWVWLAPAYLWYEPGEPRRLQNGLRVLRWLRSAATMTVSNGGSAQSPGKPPEYAWCG